MKKEIKKKKGVIDKKVTEEFDKEEFEKIGAELLKLDNQVNEQLKKRKKEDKKYIVLKIIFILSIIITLCSIIIRFYLLSDIDYEKYKFIILISRYVTLVFIPIIFTVKMKLDFRKLDLEIEIFNEMNEKGEINE
ncbi:MAG: hypothetical protein IAA81_09930 [Spirochaetes bacterium]|uniref:Uncharacterized protein n=1 Tax=Candidatus Gallitreponema excrementavium TaxID=2840840 RepID=A0A9D9HQY6_9SPIR|nr:hypothetical protein [Candidatus Gallitreponema excrementavium]